MRMTRSSSADVSTIGHYKTDQADSPNENGITDPRVYRLGDDFFSSKDPVRHSLLHTGPDGPLGSPSSIN
jgi:hypothetical protein